MRLRSTDASLTRRHFVVALAAGGLWPTFAVSAAAKTPLLTRRWTSGNTTLAPLAGLDGQILYCGDKTVGRIDPAHEAPIWSRPHRLSSNAVYRPRAAGQLVVTGGLNELGAWQLDDGRARWLHMALVQVGTPFVTPERTLVGDGHELLALDNASGVIDWRFASTADTLASYAPTVAEGSVFFGPGNGRLYALNEADGRLKWQLDDSQEWQYVRQMHVSGKVLVAGTYTELLYGIDIAAGKILWRFKAGNFINSHHVAGDSAYLWSPTGWVYAIDIRNGNVRWRHRTTNYGQSGANWGPLMAELATHGEHLYALDMFNVLHVLNLQTGDEVQRLVFPQGLRPTVLPRAGAQAVVATNQGDIQLVRW